MLICLQTDGVLLVFVSSDTSTVSSRSGPVGSPGSQCPQLHNDEIKRTRERSHEEQEQQHGKELVTGQVKGQLSERLPNHHLRDRKISGPECRQETSRRHLRHPQQLGGVTYLGFWGKQGSAETVHVAQVHLDAGVGETELVEAGGSVTRTDVTLPREGRDGDGVLQLGLGQVVADTTIDVALGTHTQKPGISRRK